MADEDVGFEIEGKTYSVPTLDTFDLSEAMILERYAGVVLEDFAPLHPEAKASEKAAHETAQGRMLSRPALKAAFAHIAFRRGNLDRDFADIQAIVEKLSLVDVTLALFAEDDESPPEVTGSPPEPGKPTSFEPLLSLSDSGPVSRNGSDEPAETPAPTGTSESGTSSPMSLVET